MSPPSWSADSRPWDSPLHPALWRGDGQYVFLEDALGALLVLVARIHLEQSCSRHVESLTNKGHGILW